MTIHEYFPYKVCLKVLTKVFSILYNSMCMKIWAYILVFNIRRLLVQQIYHPVKCSSIYYRQNILSWASTKNIYFPNKKFGLLMTRWEHENTSFKLKYSSWEILSLNKYPVAYLYNTSLTSHVTTLPNPLNKLLHGMYVTWIMPPELNFRSNNFKYIIKI